MPNLSAQQQPHLIVPGGEVQVVQDPETYGFTCYSVFHEDLDIFKFTMHSDRCPVQVDNYTGTAHFVAPNIYEVASFLAAPLLEDPSVELESADSVISRVNLFIKHRMDISCDCCARFRAQLL